MNLLRELEYQAKKDPLTGLSNRRQFLELAELELSRVQRYGSPLSMLMMDIDLFKSINDTYGHKAGDLVLQRLASICGEALREVDIMGRMGAKNSPFCCRKRLVHVPWRLLNACDTNWRTQGCCWIGRIYNYSSLSLLA